MFLFCSVVNNDFNYLSKILIGGLIKKIMEIGGKHDDIIPSCTTIYRRVTIANEVYVTYTLQSKIFAFRDSLAKCKFKKCQQKFTI